MVVFTRMERQPRIGLLLCLVLAASGSTAAGAGAEHTGEILGTNPGERTLSLRVKTPEGRELMLFQVPGEAVIRREGSDESLRFEDLKPGMKATVTSARRKDRRVAVKIVIHRDSGKP